MCRLLGIISSEAVDFRMCLREAPRSVAYLSREHRDGWGIAVCNERGDWTLQKAPCCANEDAHFHEVALGCRGVLMLAHVRKRTVGSCCMENTHPFQRGRWVFAHNGTIPASASDWLTRHTAGEFGMGVRGDTDSERLFAFVLGGISAGAPDDGRAESLEGRQSRIDRALVSVVDSLERQPGMGSCTFLLSDGDVIYAYRSGRTLFLLERRPGDAVRARRASAETGAVVETPWSPRRSAVLIASEQITDEPWHPLSEGALLRIAQGSSLTCTFLRGGGEREGQRAAG